MTHKKILKIIMAHGRVKEKDIAKKLDIKDASSFFKRLFRKNVTFYLFVSVIDLLNYELVFKPKGSNLPDYSYRIAWEDYKDLPD